TYLVKAPADVRAHFHLAQLYHRFGRSFEAAERAWEGFQRSIDLDGVRLEPAALAFCARLQAATTAETRAQRLRIIAARLRQSAARDAEAEHAYLEVWAVLSKTDDLPSPDFGLLTESGVTQAVTTEEILAIVRGAVTAREHANRAYQAGALGLDALCDL